MLNNKHFKFIKKSYALTIIWAHPFGSGYPQYSAAAAYSSQLRYSMLAPAALRGTCSYPLRSVKQCFVSVECIR